MGDKPDKHLFFLTGELSGDMHAAELLCAIHRKRPNWRFTAIGTDHLKSAGADIWYDSLKLGAIGIYEAVKRAWPVLKMRQKFIRELSIVNPDLIVAVDYRAVNLSLVTEAKKQGYRSAYYIAPVVWGTPTETPERKALLRTLSLARLSKKVQQQTKDRFTAVAEACDLAILIYPLCEDEYREAGANVHYVGHPLVNIVERKLRTQEDDFQRAEELASAKSGGGKLVGVLPGSRLHEFKHHCPVLKKVVGIIRDVFPNISFFIPLASRRLILDLERYWPGVRRECKIIGPDEYDWYKGADLLLAKSGTAVQTAMILGTPSIAFYRVVSDPLFKLSQALFLKREHWTFPNILADREVIPEFIQSEMTVENIADKAISLLRDDDARQKQRKDLLELRNLLYRPDCLEHAADLIIETAENNGDKSDRVSDVLT